MRTSWLSHLLAHKGDVREAADPAVTSRASDLVFSQNNFDLIRLFAALQVAICHSAELLWPDFAHSMVIRFLALFPGVPIFFFISGFLISRAYERSDSLQTYTRNRALRIFPALHVCLILNLLAVWATGYFQAQSASFVEVFALYLAKGTILQFYNPEFMRAFGDGVLNGSLWTICVELQFYVLIPILYYLLTGNRARANVTLLVLMALSLVCNRLLYALQAEYAEAVFWKLFRVSFLPWFYMFLIGIWLQRNFQLVQRLVGSVNFPVAFALYVAYAALMHYFGFRVDNGVSPLLTLPLFALIALAAYNRPQLADRVLHRHDISYGVYIYHMPVVNMALYFGYQQGALTLTVAIVLSLVLACLSWLCIERPCLKRKSRSLHPPASASKHP